MLDIKFSEKEISIFKGVISLIEEGINPYNIKVADIAKAADVGKGTIYDYFSSKEEVISKAILYNINNDINFGYGRIMDKQGFREKYYEILEIISEGFGNSVCSFKILLSSGGLFEFYKYLIDAKYDSSQFVVKVDQIIDDLLKIGRGDKIIKTKEDEYYQRMAIRTCITGFSHYMGSKDLYGEISLEEAMDVSYRLLLKTLN